MSLTIPLLASSHVHPQLVGPAQSGKFRIAAIRLISSLILISASPLSMAQA
jgi:hypothetical protein